MRAGRRIDRFPCWLWAFQAVSIFSIPIARSTGNLPTVERGLVVGHGRAFLPPEVPSTLRRNRNGTIVFRAICRDWCRLPGTAPPPRGYRRQIMRPTSARECREPTRTRVRARCRSLAAQDHSTLFTVPTCLSAGQLNERSGCTYPSKLIERATRHGSPSDAANSDAARVHAGAVIPFCRQSAVEEVSMRWMCSASWAIVACCLVWIPCLAAPFLSADYNKPGISKRAGGGDGRDRAVYPRV